MKLLGWMHRKFRQNSSEPLKDFGIGNACTCLTGQPSLDEQQCYPKPSYGNKPFRQQQQQQAQKDNHFFRKSFASLESAARGEESELDYEEDSASAISELFHGFLAIGTLGYSDTNNIPNPSTPTFGISVENITEKETEVTENELKLINDELEKVLGAEANKEDGCNDSSGRNSLVSNGRSSHGSTITLSGKQLEGIPDQTNIGNGFTVCPLQGYLFGSAIELSETTTTSSVAKKEHRTSLGELFQRTKLADQENSGSKCERDKDADNKSAVHIRKKLLKKKLLHASRSSNAGTVDSASAETKLHKILHMFHRKVHPESSAATKKYEKPMKKENSKKSIYFEGGHDNGAQIDPTDEDIIIFPQSNLSKEKIRHCNNQSNLPQFTISDSDSNGNREFWIKTDADYLVLEL